MAKPAGGIAVYDVAALLPKSKNKRRKYRYRDPKKIARIYVHHSGRLGKPGFAGAQNSAGYVVRHREWPGAAYHYWLSARADRDDENNLVIYQLHRLDTRCYHTGGKANTHGIGVALQGNTTAAPLTHDQQEALEALLPYLMDRFSLRTDSTPISWHSEAARFGGKSKPACPGKHAELWLRRYRDGICGASELGASELVA